MSSIFKLNSPMLKLPFNSPLSYVLWPCMFWLGALTVSVLTSVEVSAKTAGEVYADYQASVYQIRIMEEKSGSRSALGSGFLVKDGQFIVTNYHVISGEVSDPKKYRIEIDHNEQVLELDVHAVDVMNDLALLAVPSKVSLGKPFVIAERPPAKGNKVYSLGNPHDIGMTVVEGNYNGLVDDSFLDRVHFSGAINSGMSGGPAVNEESEIVGVNVASAGNQIGFLVPATKVTRLLLTTDRDKRTETQLLDEMAEQIGDATTQMVDQMLAETWPIETMGQVNIVGKIVPWVSCWGNSNENDEKKFLEIARGCNNGISTYIDQHFSTAHLEYEFFYFEANDWPSISVYQNMAMKTANAHAGNKAHKKGVGNFSCTDRQVPFSHGMVQRMSYCVRPYVKLKGLYDAFYIAVSTDRDKQVSMSHFTIAGVREEASMRFLERFMEKMAWR